jgi:hypothetical protein
MSALNGVYSYHRESTVEGILFPEILRGRKSMFVAGAETPSPSPVATLFAERANAKGQEPSKRATVSSLVLSGTGMINAFSGYVRQVFSSANKFFGTKNPTALSALGFTSGLSIVSAGLNIRDGIKEAKTAEKTSDVAGRAISYLKIATGTTSATGGAVMLPMRALTLAGVVKSSKIIASMTGILGTIGTAAFSMGSFLTGISTGIRLNEHRQFRQTLSAVLNDPGLSREVRLVKALEHLKQLAAVSPQEKAQILSELAADQGCRALSPQQQSERAAEKEKLLLEKKAAYLKRVASDDCLKLICQKGPSEAAEVVEAIQKKNREKVILSSIGMSLICIGLTITAASFIFSAPQAILISAAISFVTSLVSLLLSGHGLFQEFKKGDPGRFDKLWIFLSTVVALISISAVFFLSGGTAPLIAAAVVGVFWLAINGACYYRLNHAAVD